MNNKCNGDDISCPIHTTHPPVPEKTVIKRYDVSLDMTLTIKMKQDEPTDDDIRNAYLNKFMSMCQNGEIDPTWFTIEEIE